MSQDQPTTGDDRFEIEKKLGAGAVGAVYRARDRERQTTVALKTLRLMDAAAIYRFKREFRSLTNLAHPNLVKLYELLYAGDAWFFTMECIDGCTFREWVRPDFDDDGKVIRLPTGPREHQTGPTLTHGGKPRGHLDEPRLRVSLQQLAEGLDYLHTAGKLHRDIKPSNVLVTEEGRIVLCDFGLVADADPSPHNATAEKRVVGTPSYMSPEQARAERPTEASDWYSVGVMIYEALTGMLPFSGADTSDPILLASATTPPPPDEVAPGVPRDLAELCMGLIERKPEHRPGRDVILRALGVRATPAPRRAASMDSPFVGRDAELETLRGALDATRRGSAAVVRIHGSSGMGKTALVRHFLDSIARRDDVVVLEGRCYEQESVPYKAFDTVVDALTRQLMRLREDEVEELIPRDILALARLFPVLRRVDAVALPRMPALEPADPAESRRRAFRALREMLARMSRRKTVVVSIDDLQWGDADSSALLTEVLRPPATPRVLIIAAYRSEDAESTPFLRDFLPAHPEAIDVPIGRLSDHAAGELVRALLAGGALRQAQDERHIASMRAAIQRESDGNPFLLTELVWFAGRAGVMDATLSDARVTVEEMVDRRIAELPAPAKRLLQAVAVAGRPVPQAVAKSAAELRDDPEGAMVTLRSARLVRTRGVREDDEVECYHDKIRETVTQYMPHAEWRAWHRRLAASLEASESRDFEALSAHFREAGEPERAASYAVRAAEQAAQALAFDRAAHLYRFALNTHTPDPRDASRLWAKLAHALVQDGRGAAAADAYLHATEHAYAAEALDYQRRAAEQLLIKGHVDDGMRVLRTVLDALGMKIAPTPRRALLALLWQRAQLRLRGFKFKRRDPSQITEEELGRIDACRSVGMGLGMVDTIRGMDYQCRSVRLALDAGDLPRVARALATEAMYYSTGGPRSKRRSGVLIERAKELAEEIGEIEGIAFVRGGASLRAFQLGEFADARALATEALRLLNDHCTGVAWEIDSASQFLLWALYYLGEAGEMGARMPDLLRIARERGDLFAETCLSTGLPNNFWLFRDDPAGAREAADGTMHRWSNIGWHLQHYWHWIALCQIELYEGNGAAAYERAQSTWKTLERSLYLRIQAVRIESRELRARAALAAAAVDPARRAALLRAAAADARHIGRQGLRWSAASAAALRAGLADVGGEKDSARALDAEAERALDAAAMSLYAAAVRRRRGQLLGGDEGRHMVAEAERAMAAQDIADPARMSAVLAPAGSV